MFQEIVGAENVLTQGDALLLSPANTEEVSSVLRLCWREGLNVVPTGGGTKLDWGNTVAPRVFLSTRRLAGVREHVWQDMTATVGAGTRWTEMQQRLAHHRQRVALDPLWPDAATVGGCIATNDSGALRLRYGSLRDLVLGVTVVLADGTIARSGGKVVKNVAGYDLPKLFTGSFGTLCILTEATLRLNAIPARTSSWTLRSRGITELRDLMQKILAAALVVESLQLRTDDTGFALDVRLASEAEVVQEHEQRLKELAASAELSEANSDAWLARERMFAQSEATVLKIACLPSKIAAIVAGFALLNSAGDVRTTCVADAIGIVTASLTGDTTQIAHIVDDLRARLREHGGSVVVLQRGAAEALDVWGDLPPAIEVMRAIKREFDPQRVLSPGRFMGGI